MRLVVEQEPAMSVGNGAIDDQRSILIFVRIEISSIHSALGP